MAIDAFPEAQDTVYRRVGGLPFVVAMVERNWGGPPTYNGRRGHPRLRMRYVPG